MRLNFESSGTVAGLERLIEETASDAAVTGLMIFSCDANGYTTEKIRKMIGKMDIPIFGGIFPKIIHDRKLLNRGNVVLGLRCKVDTQVVYNISDNAVDFEKILENKFPDVERGQTMMVFIDGFARRISAFIESLFTIFGLEVNYVGGGAGSLSMHQQPCLYCNEGLVGDGAVLALVDSASGIGVSHGWDVLKGPFRVTESEHNLLKTLNWRPAFDVYHELVSSHAKQAFSASDFYDVARAYPFGITRIGNEQIVRDVLKVGPKKSLVSVGEIPEGAFISILNGDEHSLVQAAEKALERGKKALPPEKKETVRIVMDCISRVMALGDSFAREIEAITPDRVPLVGACSIGEIANSGSEFLEFYNKTIVVAIMGG